MYHLVDKDYDSSAVLYSSEDRDKIEAKRIELENGFKQYRLAAQEARNKLHYELAEKYGAELVTVHSNVSGGGGVYYKYNCSKVEEQDFTKRFWAENQLSRPEYTGCLFIEESEVI